MSGGGRTGPSRRAGAEAAEAPGGSRRARRVGAGIVAMSACEMADPQLNILKAAPQA